jgi:Fe-S cluster assembly iron-binding protein IscA
MLTVTDAAVKALNRHLLDCNITCPVRIDLMAGCCRGKSLRFVLSKLRKNDLLYTFESVVLLLDRGLSALYGDIAVDFEEENWSCQCSGSSAGFSIASQRLRHRCGWGGCCEISSGSPQQEERGEPAC